MAILQRRKVMIVTLVLYWPALFVMAHIPVPDVIVEAHMSDKSLHCLMYMLLTMLLWSVAKPYSRVHWRKAAVWWVLGIVAAYALLDEYLQNFVQGRTADPKDLVADLLGAFAGLAVLTFFSFWPSLLIGMGSAIYILAVFTRANLTKLLPVTTTIFHLGTYGLFTLLWIGYLHQSNHLRRGDRLWLPAVLAVPVGLLGFTKISTRLSGKAFEGWDMVAGGAGILIATAAVWIIGSRRKRHSAGTVLPVSAD